MDPIRRDAGQRRAAIMVNLRGRDVESFVREAEAKVKAEVKLPEGYVLEFGDAFKNLQEARTRLAVLVPATLALIFVLVFMAFGRDGDDCSRNIGHVRTINPSDSNGGIKGFANGGRSRNGG